MNAAEPHTSHGQLDVGVIYTHERHLVGRLLATLAASAPGWDLRSILVDNASAEGVGAWRDIVPRTTVLRNSARLGYAPNLNRILAASMAPFVLLLNTDMHFDPANRCLTRMLEFMEATPRCGLSTCGIYRPDGGYAFPARGPQTWRVLAARRLGLARLFRRSLDRYLYRQFAPHDTFGCEWVSGCFMLLRREAWREVGFFDERFAKYFEDVDYGRRMRLAGWQVMHHGAAWCIHDEQRDSARLISRDALRHARSYWQWSRKWGLSGKWEAQAGQPAGTVSLDNPVGESVAYSVEQLPDLDRRSAA